MAETLIFISDVFLQATFLSCILYSGSLHYVMLFSADSKLHAVVTLAMGHELTNTKNNSEACVLALGLLST
ncbi:uncharacterized protein BP01DRAFT_182258 [Aspergillus saccharolyticus JOP 1030-1]|uniref:Uncharacterized protein n=1 Tax=Aspergillus saccharolyticus JOP 1030-1 TaxID=1450539 RepID=A0A318Z1M6_9EURO|nr:hypothetical protein BP01DRAFT_182258 [Aspergillus saccharolyticus JOP 1030-1]PYH41195.1 hypothetical protein BP01DRAFT_182258 [Aspergillus saccharolyticus JOP 1030-1]